jgi:hypothetical protein
MESKRDTTEKDIRAKTVYVESLILSIRHQRVMVDADLAGLYGVSTKALNQAVKRNPDRFPADFAFLLTFPEASTMRSQIVTASKRNIRHRPLVFTEYGAIMAANVLNSREAVRMSVFVVRAFVRMREKLAANQVLEKRLAEIEKKLLLHDSSLRDLYDRIRPLLMPPPEKPKRRIGFLEEKKAVYRARG